MKKQKNPVIDKLVKETKKSVEYQVLPSNTTVEVVAILADGTTYIFDMTIDQWAKIDKKPGVQYLPYQKGFAQFKDAIRTNYFKQQ
jgi:hypothetical protein